MSELEGWVETHKPLAIGVVVVGVVALFLLFRSGGSSAAASATDPNAGAELSYATAQLQTSAQAGAQSEADQTQLAALQINAGTTGAAIASQQTIALADIVLQGSSIAASLQATMNANALASSDTQAGIGATLAANLAGDQTQVNLAAIGAGENEYISALNNQTAQDQTAALTQLGEFGDASQVQIAGITSTEQENIASTYAYVSTVQSNNATALGITQANDTASVGIAQADATASVAKSNSGAAKAIGIASIVAAAL